VKIENSRFLNNSAESGGAIAMGPAAATPGIQISNTQFTNNFGNGPAQGVGGAIWAAAGCLVVVTTGAFTNNRAIQGGAIFTSPGVVLTIIGSPTTGSLPTAMQFNTNGAVSDGGAIFAFQSTASITNAAFSQNQTPPDQVLGRLRGRDRQPGRVDEHPSKGFFFKNGGRFGAALHSRAQRRHDGEPDHRPDDLPGQHQRRLPAAPCTCAARRPARSSPTRRSRATRRPTPAAASCAMIRRCGSRNSSFTRNSAARGGGLVVSTLPGRRGAVRSDPERHLRRNSATMGVGGVYNSASGVELYSTTIAANVGGGRPDRRRRQLALPRHRPAETRAPATVR
jgi:predicted outer membrane repeat protein